MGYHLVDLILTDGRMVPNVPIFNCEIAELPSALVQPGLLGRRVLTPM